MKVTAFLREFWVCTKAITTFSLGYKAGEGYWIGKKLAGWARRIDPAAWNSGYQLAYHRRSPPYRVTGTAMNPGEGPAVPNLSFEITGESQMPRTRDDEKSQ